LQRFRVLHITLEMSEALCAQRYLQAMLAISKRDEAFQITRFQRDKLGRLSGLDPKRVKPKLSLDDANIRPKLEAQLKRGAHRYFDNVYIKQFPSGALTVTQLKAYMDNMEVRERFVPDLLIVDYPDLLKLDPHNYRLEIDTAFKEIRGIAVERNIAVAVVSQSHRSAAKAKHVGAENVAEAYSKIAHSDTVLTYTQTKQELALGLARLHVAKGRNDRDRFTLVISQQYGYGAFVIDSVPMQGSAYWNLVPKPEEEAE